MKILLIHNFYGSSAPSGENTVYLSEADFLRSRGHKVIEFTRHSDEIRNSGLMGMVRGALSTPWNPFVIRKLRYLLGQERPDIMHVHNTFPLLSPAVFHAAEGLSTATVLTLHNYRTFCASGIPMRNYHTCTECLDRRSILFALRYGCYRGSRLATIPMAAMIGIHRVIGTWQRHVDAFIALTEFQREKLVNAGLPGELVHVKPHFYPDPPIPIPWDKREKKVVYIGRLESYKGVHILIEAWERWGDGAPVLEIIGEGPQKPALQQAAGRCRNGRIVFTGHLSFPDVQKRLAHSRLLTLPSLCFEGFPMVMREAFALGVPAAASRIGSIPFILADGKTGVLFTPGDALSLLENIKGIWDGVGLETMGRAAREEFERKYTAETNYKIVMNIYETAMIERRGRYED